MVKGIHDLEANDVKAIVQGVRNSDIVEELAYFIRDNGGYIVVRMPDGQARAAQHGRQIENKGALLWRQDFVTEREAYREILNRMIGNPSAEPLPEQRVREIAREEAQKAVQAAINGIASTGERVFKVSSAK